MPELDDGLLDGKAVLVSGGTRGIGAAIAAAATRNGARVVVTGRRPDVGRTFAASLGGQPVTTMSTLTPWVGWSRLCRCCRWAVRVRAETPAGTAVRDRRSRMSVKTPSEQIDDIIAMHPDWRGQRLAQLRQVILDAAPGIGEDVKWKKPSRPEGVAVWTHGGNLCIGEVLKRAVRLTFPQGASLADPAGLFNTRLDSKTVRAIDFAEGDVVQEAALQALIVEAIRS